MGEADRMEQQKRAEEALGRVVEADPGWSVERGEAGWLVGTNLVTFGAFDGQPVVFKYFDWSPRKEQEERALRWFAPTGLVPNLYPVESDSVLVMERLRGETLNALEPDLDEDKLRRVYEQLGRAMARIVEVAPGGSSAGRRDLRAGPGFDYQFYCQADLETLFDTVVERSSKVLAEQDVPQRDVLERSLAELRDSRDAILAYPGFVQMDDFHTSNIMADRAELTGFIDLEMTRCGNEVLLVAAALAMMAAGPRERWAWIRRGYEERRGKPMDAELLDLACVAAPFSQWTRFMWYWTGDPRDLEEGARGWPIRDIRAIVETLGDLML